MISSPFGVSAGDNDDEALSSAAVPVRSCPGTAGTPAEDAANSKIAAIAALCRFRRFMIWNNLHSIVVLPHDLWPLSDSLDNLQDKTVDAMLEAHELSEERGRDVAEDVAIILMIRQIYGIKTEPHFTMAGTAYPRQGQMEVAVNPCIQREEGRKSLPVGLAHIVLQYIHIRVGETRVDVEDGIQRYVQGDVKSPPCDEAVRNIGGRNAEGIRANHRLLKWNEDCRRGIEIAAVSAPNIGKIQIAARDGLKMIGGFKLMVTRHARVRERQERSSADVASKGIDNK